MLVSYARVLQLVHANGAISVLEDYSSFSKGCCDCQVFVITVQWPSVVTGNMSISSSSSSRRCCRPPLGCQVPCVASPSRTDPRAWTPVTHPDACSIVGFCCCFFGGCSLFVVVYSWTCHCLSLQCTCTGIIAYLACACCKQQVKDVMISHPVSEKCIPSTVCVSSSSQRVHNTWGVSAHSQAVQ